MIAQMIAISSLRKTCTSILKCMEASSDLSYLVVM